MSILKSKHSGWTWEGRRTPLGGGKGGGAPPPPDYTGAAAATAQGNLEATRAAASANRVNQVTPYGTLTYTRNTAPTFNEAAYKSALDTYNQARASYAPQTDEWGNVINPFDLQAPRYSDFMITPSPDEGWVATQQLSPDQQALYQYDIAASKGLGQLAQTGLNYVQNMMANPFSTSSLPAMQTNLTPAQMQQIAGGPQLGMAGQTPTALQVGQAEQARGISPQEQAVRIGQGPQLSALETAQALRQAGPTENLQRSLGENVGMKGWDRASNLLMQRLAPQMQVQQEQLDAKLAAQGIPIGSEAYNRAKAQLGMQQNDLLNQAQLQAQGIQQNLFGQELAAGQFGNQATTQQQQNLLQNLGFSNQAQQQDYANRQAQLAFNNEMAQAGYQNQLAAQQANNAAIAQNFAQGLSAQQLQNQAAQQNYTNQIAGQEFNASQNQQDFANRMAALGYNNQQIQQMYANQVAQQQANNAIAQQQFANQLTGANLANQARQQGFGELAYMRNEPLNTLNAVRSGAQVTPPSFINVPQQATAAGPDYLGAANAQYANQMAGYNAQQAAQSNLMGGLMGLGGTLGGAAILASDPRMKENVKAIGVMPNGLTLYSFEYKDEFKDHQFAGHGVHVGVMADEVEKVYPYAVSTLDDGYKVVNYGLIP